MSRFTTDGIKRGHVKSVNGGEKITRAKIRADKRNARSAERDVSPRAHLTDRRKFKEKTADSLSLHFARNLSGNEKAAISTLPLPELLAPAGSPKALEAAIDGGADAVYFGVSAFNARINAKNFSGAELTEAFDECHAYGVKTYVTLNTLAGDREIADFLKTAEEVHRLGADALIVADFGCAAMLRRYLPDFELHASTQMSGHNIEAAVRLQKLGFSRMVLAREVPLADIREFVKNSPIEAEVFIHGALCVSHSGQCLFSSLVGGRSGNRGECAQPCRLPYSSGKSSGEQYPLSLRDLCLATHVTELIDAGVASLKIEGRMKSPEYVREVTKVYRTLLDERRCADDNEIRYLASIFSRSGFTDGYFVSEIGHNMLGVRSISDKETSRMLAPFDKITRKIPIDLSAKILADKPSELTVTHENHSVTVYGDIPMAAINAPLDRDTITRSLEKLGDTPYKAGKVSIMLGNGLMLPISKLNQLRRAALDAFVTSLRKVTREPITINYENPFAACGKAPQICRSARFFKVDSVTEIAVTYFKRIYFPLREFCEYRFEKKPFIDMKSGRTEYGVVLPAVIFDHERKEVAEMVSKAAKHGAKYALVANVGQIDLAQGASLIPVADFRFNVYNSETALVCKRFGFSSCVLSPELTLPQIRDIEKVTGDSPVICYGRIPLMLLEKCVTKEMFGCSACGTERAVLTDRKNVCFPVLREWKHRNIICNSLPTYMADRQKALRECGINEMHFIFTIEDGSEVDGIIAAYESGLSPDSAGLNTVRRIKD